MNFFYDTETTGVPLFKERSTDPRQPHMTQVAAILHDENRNEIASMVRLIKPDGWVIPRELEIKIGITTERASEEGIPLADAMEEFMSLWRRSQQRIAHNEFFDMRIVRTALWRDLDRMDEAEQWKNSPWFCTQRSSVNILCLPPTVAMRRAGRTHFKSPNLSEAYRHFTGKTLEGAHDAMNDARAVAAVYYGIQDHQRRAAEEVFA